jgi:dimethylargininase
VLPAEPGLPDSVFVEDTAVVVDKVAIITRPGAEARRPETRSVARALRPHRRLAFIQPPGVLDGGDVLCLGKKVFIGLSTRSNRDAIDQVRAMLSPLGYAVQAVEVRGCLHLKSAVTRVAENRLLINQAWVDAASFDSFELIDVDPSEPSAGNALLVDDRVIYPAHHPATRRRLHEAGVALEIVDLSELAKAEGGVTCCSLIFDSGLSG